MEADALSRIDWKKCDKTIQADSIQVIVTVTGNGHGNDHIESTPCSPQTKESLFPSISDGNHIISKAIKLSSGQSHLTHPEAELSALELRPKSDTSRCLGISNDFLSNPECMTPADYAEAQT